MSDSDTSDRSDRSDRSDTITKLYRQNNWNSFKKIILTFLIISCCCGAVLLFIIAGGIYSENMNRHAKNLEDKEMAVEVATKNLENKKIVLGEKELAVYDKQIKVESDTVNNTKKLINKLTLMLKQKKKERANILHQIEVEPITYLVAGVILLLLSILLFFIYRVLYQESQRILCRIDRFNRFALADNYCSILENLEGENIPQPNVIDVLKVMSSIELANKLTKKSLKLKHKLEKLKAKKNKNNIDNYNHQNEIKELKKKIEDYSERAEAQRRKSLQELSKLKTPQKESIEVRSGLIKAIYKFEKEEC